MSRQHLLRNNYLVKINRNAQTHKWQDLRKKTPRTHADGCSHTRSTRTRMHTKLAHAHREHVHREHAHPHTRAQVRTRSTHTGAHTHRARVPACTCTHTRTEHTHGAHAHADRALENVHGDAVRREGDLQKKVRGTITLYILCRQHISLQGKHCHKIIPMGRNKDTRSTAVHGSRRERSRPGAEQQGQSHTAFVAMSQPI